MESEFWRFDYANATSLLKLNNLSTNSLTVKSFIGKIFNLKLDLVGRSISNILILIVVYIRLEFIVERDRNFWAFTTNRKLVRFFFMLLGESKFHCLLKVKEYGFRVSNAYLRRLAYVDYVDCITFWLIVLFFFFSSPYFL